ncbi:MCE family protein [Antrihabitans sp. YC2-6]|uniref:MCE family protein n=1 Tax=Antrihabitans sp. YC2-6 TaxID=2799498 RepID=UPI0018F2ACED|nr:MCE family protein [Antrihabitans sp. YC2-6]MBJ8345765.1 MCE family protein [Antrihabitans sp. YC2-6]
MTEPGWVKKLAALGLVGGLVAIVVVALTMFAGGFVEKVPVTVTAPRSGLVMDPDAKVKMRGVEVGRVKSIEETPEGATLTLDMQPNMLKYIPANAKVDIKSTTVFGAKYVNFVYPSDPSPEHLTAGSTVAADAVTVEFNTLFQHLSDVLQKLEPEKINATLGALSTALRGRGEQVGELLTAADDYLADINPSLPTLQRDFQAAAGVTNLYADVSPDLLQLVDDATAVSGTIVDEQVNLDALLLSVIGLSNTGETVLAENEQNLDTALDLLRPTTGLLDRYSPVLSCLILGLDKARPIAEAVEGGLQEGIALNAGFTYSQDPYTYPNSLPKVNATGGPNCVGLPDRVPNDPHAPFIVTDTATVPYVPNTQLKFNAPKVFQILLGDLYAGLAQP